MARPSTTNYLGICALYRDEGPYLAEWVEFHLLVGVTRFFLYNNLSEDEHREVLAPYIEAGIVELVDWPLWPGMKQAYAHCLDKHPDDTRWIAFIDIDEFLFSPVRDPLPTVLADYEQWPGVGVNWAQFGNSGHVTKPPGLVIENYVHRSNTDWHNNWIKTIADPTRVERPSGNNHCLHYRSGLAVDENMRPIDEPYGRTDSVSYNRLRINHYRMKSEQEFVKRSQLPWQWGKETRPQIPVSDLGQMLNACRDETILPYVQPLREALRLRGRPPA
jgi:hypothetical protein